MGAGDPHGSAAVVQAMPYGGLAYFNHGPDSGQSQPHKHIQVVPLPLSREVDSPVPLQDVLDETLQGEPLGTACEMLKLPYRAYACRIDPRCVPEASAVPITAALRRGAAVPQMRSASARWRAFSL